MRTDWPAEYESHWTTLAKKHNVRLPQKATVLTTGGLESWCRKLGLSTSGFREWTGGMGFKQFVAANSDWSLRATVGLILELRDEAGPLRG